jgi:uncharacterized glyoxalase superfamily protein PhnB
MSTTPIEPVAQKQSPYHIVDLNYISLYFKEFAAAVAFYSRVFGAPDSTDEQRAIYSWRMGATWLTLFPSKIGTEPAQNPHNTEFAIQVASVEEVDLLYQALLASGATDCMAPEDTTMYDPMRFACVDDPFGVRIDIYCTLAKDGAKDGVKDGPKDGAIEG